MPINFSEGRLKKIEQLEGWHFWFLGRRQLVYQLLQEGHCLPTKVLVDIGCGTGGFMESILDKTDLPVGIDQRSEGILATHLRQPGFSPIQGDAGHIPLCAGCVDGIFLFDILEHTDDQAALLEAARILKPGGWLIASVPAFPSMWSFRDQAAGHLRRYTRKGFINVLEENFSITRIQYYQFLFFPFLALSRWLGRRTADMRDLEENVPGRLNRVLAAILIGEVKMSRYISYPWGSTLLALCKKR